MQGGGPIPHTIQTIEWQGDEIVRPSFEGFGLANVAPTVLHTLVGSQHESPLPPLAPQCLPAAMLAGVQNIIVFAIDGLGHLQLQREVAAGNAPAFRALLDSAHQGGEGAVYSVLTSVFPSTTVAALGALNSGGAPANHGLLGYTQYVPELGGVGEMIRWGPFDRRGSFGDAGLGGHDPEAFFWFHTVYQQLRHAGVQRAFAVNPVQFAGTALTRMLHQGADIQGYYAPSSIAALVPRLARGRARGERTYIYAYWSQVDTVAHHHGPESAEHSAEVAVLDRALERLLDNFSVHDDTLLVLTADHGHVQTSPEQQVYVDQFHDLVELLAQPPAGERRAMYLHAKTGEVESLVDAARDHLSEYALVMKQSDAISHGLYGPEPISDRARERIGDVILLARASYQLTFQPPDAEIPESQRLSPPPPFRGVHGGLSPEEALVPLLALRV